MTTTLGGATLGNWEIGRVLIDNPPRNKMMIEITIANAGRRRNCENMVPRESGWFPYFSTGKRLLFRVVFQVCSNLLRLTILVFHLVAVANLSDPLENDLVVHANPLLDDKQVLQSFIPRMAISR